MVGQKGAGSSAKKSRKMKGARQNAPRAAAKVSPKATRKAAAKKHDRTVLVKMVYALLGFCSNRIQFSAISFGSRRAGCNHPGPRATFAKTYLPDCTPCLTLNLVRMWVPAPGS
jgi:hypothetical protein